VNGFLKSLLGAGCALLLAGRGSHAADAKTSTPEAAPPAVAKAIGLLQAGKPNEAVAVLDEALKADGKDLQLRFAKAMVLLQAQRPAEALPLAEALAKDDPQNPKARLLLGRALIASGRPADAVNELAETAESVFATADLLEVFAGACLEANQPVRAQRAFLGCIRQRAGAGEGGLMAQTMRAAVVAKDLTRFRQERIGLLLAYALQNHESALGLTRGLFAAGDDAFRRELTGTVTRHLGSRTNFVARAVVAIARGETPPEAAAKDTALRRIRAASAQAMFTVGCRETNFPAAGRKRGELLKTLQNDNVEEGGEKFLQVTLKTEVDSKLTLGSQTAGGRDDLQSTTAAVAAIALEVQRQRPEARRKAEPLRLHAETGTYVFDVTSDDETLTLTRQAAPGAEEFEREFDLEGLPPELAAAF
jgi:tetratricopeptide (TPR) repeat protein